MLNRLLAALVAVILAIAGMPALAQTPPPTFDRLEWFEIGHNVALVGTLGDRTDVINGWAALCGPTSHTKGVVEFGGVAVSLDRNKQNSFASGNVRVEADDACLPPAMVVGAGMIAAVHIFVLNVQGLPHVDIAGFCEGDFGRVSDAAGVSGFDVTRLGDGLHVRVPAGFERVLAIDCAGSPAAASAAAHAPTLDLTVAGLEHPADFVARVCSSLRHDEAFSDEHCAALVATLNLGPMGLVTAEALKAPKGHVFTGRDLDTVRAILARHDGQVSGWVVDADGVRYLILQGACTEVCDGPVAIYHLNQKKLRPSRPAAPTAATPAAAPPSPAPRDEESAPVVKCRRACP